MIYKCRQCDSALEYNPINDKMECVHCGGAYTIYELENGTVSEGTVRDSKEAEALLNESLEDTEEGQQTVEERRAILEYMKHAKMMSCKVYTCTACGADVIINDVELSTFCSYCGQPTIVFERMQEELEPDYIVPFKITQDQAVSAIRQRIRRTFFHPRSIREVKPEVVRGVYIPHWIFDMHYYDYQSWRCEYVRDDTRVISFHEIEAECDFHDIAVDASENVDDELAQLVGPFDLRCKKPFEPAYLAGHYADMFDKDQNQMSISAVNVAKPLFDEQLKGRIRHTDVRLAFSKPHYTVQAANYVMLPVWIFTYKYRNIPHTMLVNGQTGKMVGVVPTSRKAIIVFSVIVAIILSVLCCAIGYLVGMQASIACMSGITLIACFLGAVNLSGLRRQLILTQTRDIVNYAKGRQDRV